MTVLIVAGLSIAYSLPTLYFWRRWAWEATHDYLNSKGDALFIGLLQALFWPVMLSWRLVESSDTFILPPPSVRQQEREASLQRRIDELEREAGIK